MTKHKTQTTQTNTYGQITPQDTPDIIAARDAKFTEDPGIGHQFALAKENVHNAYANPLGAYTTPDVQKKQLLSEDAKLNQEESQAHREGQYDVNNLTNTKNMALAGLTAPKIVQTGGTGTTVQNDGLMSILGPLIGAGATVASAGMAPGAS